jgi:hypothetical protein
MPSSQAQIYEGGHAFVGLNRRALPDIVSFLER